MTTKRDHGALLHSQKIGSEVRLNFYDVPIHEVALTDPPGLTTMVELMHDGEVYAVSFDFTPDAAAHLLARCDDGVFARLDAAAASTTARGRTVALDPPLRVHIEATLGVLQRSPRELFAPLVVHRIG